MVVTSSRRRFDVDTSNQPVYQFICATIPVFLLLVWFLWNASRRPHVNCYVDATTVDDDVTSNNYYEKCSKLIPLVQFIYVYWAVGFLASLMLGYLTIYVPRRHRLIETYLAEGIVAIGDVYVNNKKRKGLNLVSLTAYGSAVYTHPDDVTTRIKRRVDVFERYTRERAAVLYLQGLPCSGQPKVDLEIDRDVYELNRDRMKILFWYTWAWVIFSLLAPIHIVMVLEALETDGSETKVWEPDVNVGTNFSLLFYLATFIGIPVISILWNLVAWYVHKGWMTRQHKQLKVDEPVFEEDEGRTGCCFDDEDCETIEASDYKPPTIDAELSTKRGKKK
jgi:hypothetical protein